MTSYLIGIDTGGTFTDVAVFEPASRKLHITKVPSTPADPSQAVLSGLTQAVDPREVSFFAHGTTVATNSLLELKGAKAGLLINRGFRLVYQLRGGARPSGSDLIDTFYQKAPVLVSQHFTEEVGGRLAYDGSEVEPLHEASVREAVRRLKAKGAASIAVCYLFSFMNPAHEQRTSEIIQEEHPGCRVSLSSTVLPVIREYQRISTTVIDAYVGPVIETYLRRLSKSLADLGVTSEQKFIMQSNGGLMRVDIAASYPNQTLLSGPAAGVVFGAQLGKAIGERNVVTFDMGGTSTDISVMPDNTYQETREGKISGQDIGTPMIQIRTLGAGGGTIAWIDPDGLLKAGPRSAGASPGPACYGQGGEEPTITDANLVLGYLGTESLVGGSLKLDPEKARSAIRTKLATPLNMTLEQAAQGIIKVVNVNMEAGIRLSLAERGLDPRTFALVAFGGAGPLHAARVARNVGIPRVVVPPYPGISCAMGLLQTDVVHHYLRSRLAPLTDLPTHEIDAIFAGLRERALTEASEEGFQPDQVALHYQMDLRYPYQGYELTVPCKAPPFGDADKEATRRSFDQLHQKVYGISAPDEAPDVVNLRIMSVSEVPHLELPDLPEASGAPKPVQHRGAFFEETGAYVETPVYQRDALSPGHVLEAPAIVEQFDSTTVVLPGQRAEVGRFGTIVISVES